MSGLILSDSDSISIGKFINLDIKLAVSPIDISKLLAELITSPIVVGDSATAIKAEHVSLTKLKSLVGFKEPNFILEFFFDIWVIICGITALLLCLGP